MSSPLCARHLVLLTVAVLCLSSAVLLIQLSTAPPATLSAWRLFLAGVVLFPLAWREWARHRAAGTRIPLDLTLLPGCVLAVHLITWVIGARQTPTANASLIANMAPVALPGLLYLLVKERVSRREWIGTGIVLLGLVVLVGGDVHLSAATARGDLICFASMLFLAFYFALARQRSPQIPGFALYITPLYFTAGAACVAYLGITGGPLLPEPSQWKWVVALALVPTVVGHGLLNYAMKHLRGQVVAVASQTQFIFAGTAAYFVFGTVPAITFYPACVLALWGAVFVLRKSPDAGEEKPHGRGCPAD